MKRGKVIDVAQFYNTYAVKESKNRKNLRHYKILYELVRSGMKGKLNVFEVGCGNGVLSELLFKKVSNGTFLGVDISPTAIEMAKKRFAKYPNASFKVSDMLEFKHSAKFDFIIFADVLEHIPETDHSKVFESISKVCHSNTKIFINIPSPEFNNYLRRKEPNKLQIIDQELNLAALIDKAFSAGFEVERLARYSIFRRENDYIKIWLRTIETSDFSKRKSRIIRLVDKYKSLLLSKLA